jgi:hypothetical protein
MEEERRLFYVAITRAERSLAITHAMRRRVYGEEMPSQPSRFLNELPVDLLEDCSHGASWLGFATSPSTRHNREAIDALMRGRSEPPPVRRTSNYTGKTYDSVDSIRDFFAKRGRDVGAAVPGPKPAAGPAPGPSKTAGAAGFTPGARVRHPKYGVKLTVTFPGYGQKKFVAKFAQLEKA